MEVFLNPDAWVALVTLTFLEIVLGIDNIIFISIVTGKLPPEERKNPNIDLPLRLVLYDMAFVYDLLFSTSNRRLPRQA